MKVYFGVRKPWQRGATRTPNGLRAGIAESNDLSAQFSGESEPT